MHKMTAGRKSMKLKSRWLSVLLALFCLTSCAFLPAGRVPEAPASESAEHQTEAPAETHAEASTEPSTEPQTEASTETQTAQELTVHFLDVGQGDSTLILCGADAMLIDAGNDSQGTKIQSYLQKQGVQKLNYVIATHPDSDHIGGLDVVLYKFDCETILMTDTTSDAHAYRDVIDTMQNKGYQITVPTVGEQYTLGDAEFTIVGPLSTSDESNNNSIAILLSHGENKFLFTGDAEEKEEADILESGMALDADVYKAGHHGSETSSSEKLLQAVSPSYAVISCATGNSYGHPHAQTLNRFRSMGIEVFRTDEQGTIVAASDGTEIRWNCSPSETWQPGEVSAPSPTVTASEQVTETASASSEETAEAAYICNQNTKKFHKPSCSSVKDMSEKNKLPVTLSREELINQGYQPCKRCNP
jgi:competence protein ComEC